MAFLYGIHREKSIKTFFVEKKEQKMKAVTSLSRLWPQKGEGVQLYKGKH